MVKSRELIDFFTVLNTQFLETGLCRKLEYHLPYIKWLSTLEATKELMNSNNYFVNIQLLRFILSCLNLRNNLLSIIISSICWVVCFCNTVLTYSHANKAIVVGTIKWRYTIHFVYDGVFDTDCRKVAVTINKKTFFMAMFTRTIIHNLLMTWLLDSTHLLQLN